MTHPSPLTDDVLDRARAGERDAQAQVLDRYGPVVWSLARRLTHEPEDAYQEVWAKVFGALHGFDPYGPASFSTWVATVAHRHLVDRHRHRQVRGEVVPLTRIPPKAEGMDEQVDRRRRLERTEAALKTLPEKARRVVVAHCLHGVPLKEIAADEGVPVGTIKARLHRARAALVDKVGR